MQHENKIERNEIYKLLVREKVHWRDTLKREYSEKQLLGKYSEEEDMLMSKITQKGNI